MTTVFLPADMQLTVTPAALSSGSLVRLSDAPGGEPYAPVALSASTAVTVGPFATPRRYQIYTTQGTIAHATSPVSEIAQDTVAITGGTISGVTITGGSVSGITDLAVADGGTGSSTAAGARTELGLGTVATQDAVSVAITGGAITGVTLTDCELGDATDVLLLSNAGAPADAVRATLSRNPAGDDNALTFTAVAYGTGGNAITIAYVDPAANDAVLGVVVVGSAVTVNLATGGAGAITSTAADILAAWELSVEADALATVAIDATDSGVADDGSGVVTALAAANFTGGAGTFIGTAGKGSLCSDYTNGVLYINVGTKAVPDWNAV